MRNGQKIYVFIISDDTGVVDVMIFQSIRKMYEVVKRFIPYSIHYYYNHITRKKEKNLLITDGYNIYVRYLIK